MYGRRFNQLLLITAVTEVLGSDVLIKKSTQVAMGGIASALCLLLMLLTIIPIATYTMPALAGMVLIVVVIENGYSTAWMVYAAVGFLSLFICPDKEAAMLFVGFFGYYPIIKGKLERIRIRAGEYTVKFIIFNAAMVANYLVIIFLFGMQKILEEVGPLGQYSVLALLALGNVVFFVYDLALSKIIMAYKYVLRKKIFRRIG